MIRTVIVIRFRRDISPYSAAYPDFDAFDLAPTLRVGIPSSTLRVDRGGQRERGRGAAKTAFPRRAWERDSDVITSSIERYWPYPAFDALSIFMNSRKSSVLSCQVRALTRLPSTTQGRSA
jgi:hypothetical protein